MLSSGLQLVVAILAGFVPAIFWLILWFNMDKHPEPLKPIVGTFILGFVAVIASIFLEIGVGKIIADEKTVLLVNAFIEEFVKFGLVMLFLYGASFIDEPVDFGVYLVTVGLGFAGFENMLFLLDNSLVTFKLMFNLAYMRAIGATVLHSLTGLIIGVGFALVYRSNLVWKRRRYVGFGFLVAWALHFAFNYSIVAYGYEALDKVLFVLWLVMFLMMYVYKVISTMK